jgi:hypothetical protein
MISLESPDACGPFGLGRRLMIFAVGNPVALTLGVDASDACVDLGALVMINPARRDPSQPAGHRRDGIGARIETEELSL